MSVIETKGDVNGLVDLKQKAT